MTFKTATREYRCESAAELVDALRRDGLAATAARRPSSTFLEAWIEDFDARAADGAGVDEMALEILYLCHQYRLGVLTRDSTRPARGAAGNA